MYRDKLSLQRLKKLSSLNQSDSTLIAECHIMLEKLLVAFDEFNAAKDNVLLLFSNT